MLHLRQLAEEKMQQTVETAVDPIITINDKGIVQTANSATTRLLGYAAEEMVGVNITLIMPEPHPSNHDNYIKNYIRTKTKKIIGNSREVSARTKSGELIPVVLSVSEILVGGERLFTGILHDLRAEKEKMLEVEGLNTRLEKENQQRTIKSELEDGLRGLDDVKEFSEAVLQFFAKQFNALLSMFYLVDSEKKIISLISGYGFKDRRKRATKFKWGEGLVGECIKSRQPIVIKEPEKDYVKVSSGLGGMLPKQILLVPLLHDNEVVGAIELCFTQAISQELVNYINKLCSDVVMGLKVALAKQNLQQLLTKTESQRQSLQQQEEELRVSNEELESQTQALKQSEEELRSTNEELHVQLSLIEK